MRIGMGMCLALVACSTRGGDFFPPVDASVTDVSAGPRSGFAFGPAVAGYGPDPAPQRCDGDSSDGYSQCDVPLPVCIEGGVAVSYAYPQCLSGACVWQKEDVRCDVVDGGVCVGGADAALPVPVDGGIWVRNGACALPVAVPPVPVVPCGEDAGDAAGGADAGAAGDAGGDAGNGGAIECAPPHSVCAGGYLLYYDDGACVAGQCSWEQRLMSCSPNQCSQGACVYVGTSASPPTL